MKKRIKGLVFSGGGLRGLAYIGALKAMEEYGLISPSLEFFSGCSIGAVMAVIISIGYTAEELYDFVLHFQYDSVKDLNVLGFFDNYGLETGNKIQKFMRLMLKRKTGLDNPTFADLYKLNGRHLVINATCINTHTVEYFDYNRTPTMPVAIAIRMSISLPFLMVPVRWQGKLYVDGAVMDNFPLHLYKNPGEILGFRLGNDQVGCESIGSFMEFAQHTWSSLYGELMRLKLECIQEYPYITIPIEFVHTFNLSLTRSQRIRIYRQGYETTKSYLAEHLDSEEVDGRETPNLVEDILKDIEDADGSIETRVSSSEEKIEASPGSIGRTSDIE